VNPNQGGLARERCAAQRGVKGKPRQDATDGKTEKGKSRLLVGHLRKQAKVPFTGEIHTSHKVEVSNQPTGQGGVSRERRTTHKEMLVARGARHRLINCQILGDRQWQTRR